MLILSGPARPHKKFGGAAHLTASAPGAEKTNVPVMQLHTAPVHQTRGWQLYLQLHTHRADGYRHTTEK